MSNKLYTALYITSFLATIVLSRAVLMYFWWLSPLKFCSNNISMMVCIYASNLDMLFRMMLVSYINNYITKCGLIIGSLIPIGADLLSVIAFKVGCDSGYVVPWFPSVIVTLGIHGIHALLCLIYYNNNEK